MIMDGKKVSEEILFSVSEIIRKNKLNISLAIISVGNCESSKVYIKSKKLACEKVGIKALIYEFSGNNELEIINLIKSLNENENIHGIILQSPLPQNLDYTKISNKINPIKDVDGVTAKNVYKNYLGKKTILPCTVKGILKLINYYDIDLIKKNVCIIGKSNLVGKPLALTLENLGATVTLCHTKTKFIGDFTEIADIIILACGKPKILKEYMVKEDSIVIDVGINKIDGKLCGDADFESLINKCKYITPVPGGVGPMTVASILENTLLCYNLQNKNE